jgi:hypothetical protein
VQLLVAERKPLSEIEGYVNELPLDGEHKSALWLLAWSQANAPLTPARQQKRSRTVHSGQPVLAARPGASGSQP